MSDVDSTTTFADTNVYGGIYFYTYAMICFVIIIGGFYFSTKYRLYYESYQLLHDIENEFGIATLGIKALEIKYNINNKGDKERAREKVLNIEIKDVRHEVKNRFNNICQMVEYHETQLLKKIDKIEELKNEQENIAKSRKMNSSAHNNSKNNKHDQTQLALQLELQTKESQDQSKQVCSKWFQTGCFFEFFVVLCCLLN